MFHGARAAILSTSGFTTAKARQPGDSLANVPSAELARAYMTGEDVYLGQGRWWRWKRDGIPVGWPLFSRKRGCWRHEPVRVPSIPHTVNTHHPCLRLGAVLHEVDALPLAEQQAPLGKAEVEVGVGEQGANVGRHVVRPFVAVAIGANSARAH